MKEELLELIKQMKEEQLRLVYILVLELTREE